MKHNARRSTGTTVTPTGLNESQPHTSINGENFTLSNVITLLKQMNDNFARIDHSNEELKQLIVNNNSNELNNDNAITTLEHNFLTMQTKIDQHITSETTNNTQVLGKLNDLQEAIHLSSAHMKKSGLTIRSTPAEHKNRNRSSVDPLNWSFSFNQTTLPNDNVELYQLLNSFEQNTWSTFDYLRHKLNENTETVLNIESICNDINSKNHHQRLESPVTESIKIDTLQTIYDKCEIIEEKILTIDSTIRAFSLDDHRPHGTESSNDQDMSDFTTQHLRERLEKLVSTNDTSNFPPQDEAYTASNDDLMNYPVIEELLAVPLPFENNRIIDTMNSNQHKSIPAKNRDRYEFYVTKFSTNTTVDMILQYMRSRGAKISDSTKVSCLVPRNKDWSTLTFLSFKVDVDADVAKLITSPGFWPDLCTIKEFVHKSIVNISDDAASTPMNFLSTSPVNVSQR